MMICIAVAALLSGACVAGFMAMVTKVLEIKDTPATWMAWVFVALAAGRLLTNFIAQVLLAHFSQQNSVNLRRDLVSKILSVPLRQLEEIGAPRMMVALTEDVLILTEAMLIIPAFAVNVAILFAGAILSRVAFLDGSRRGGGLHCLRRGRLPVADPFRFPTAVSGAR